MAEKTVKTKQPAPEKPNLFQRARTADKEKDKDREKTAQPRGLAKWYRETIGELRKVAWPSTQETWRLTRIVIIVMTLMSIVLYLFDFLFSKLISLLVA